MILCWTGFISQSEWTDGRYLGWLHGHGQRRIVTDAIGGDKE